MNDVLRDVLGRFVFVYLDDIVIFSRTGKEHLQLWLPTTGTDQHHTLLVVVVVVALPCHALQALPPQDAQFNAAQASGNDCNPQND